MREKINFEKSPGIMDRNRMVLSNGQFHKAKVLESHEDFDEEIPVSTAYIGCIMFLFLPEVHDAKPMRFSSGLPDNFDVKKAIQICFREAQDARHPEC